MKMDIVKHLSDSLSESVSRGSISGKYNRGMSEEQRVRKGLIDQLYLDMTDEIPYSKCGSDASIVKYLSGETNGDCLWCVQLNSFNGLTYYLAGKDNKAASIMFDKKGNAVGGETYEIDRSVITMHSGRSQDLEGARKYFAYWIDDTPW